MRKSTYFQIFLTMSIIVFISFSLLGGLATVFSYRRSAEEKQTTMISALDETARYVATQYLYYGVDLDDLDLSMFFVMASRLSSFDVLLTDADGIVMSCSQPSFAVVGSAIPASDLAELRPGGATVFRTTLGGIYPVQRQTAAIPLSVRINGDVYVYSYLFIVSDVAAFGREWRDFSPVFLLPALFVLTLAMILSFFMSKIQTKPINEMVIAVRRFARGEFNLRVKSRGRQDELGELTDAFNYMADSIENTEKLRRDFIASLSHELKTPMTVIAGFADGLHDGTIPKENEAQYLNVISSETKRLSRLVKSMLELSVLGEMPSQTYLAESFDISEVVRLALLSLDSKIESKRLDVEAVLPDEPIMTRGNEDAIIQVVFNLIDNAIKFSTPGSTIGLELWQQDKRVFVSVCNHGETVPPEELPYIFQRFHKADKSRSADRDGVGLGLYIVKTILDNHNEDIFVTSADGVTKFVFSLTLAG